MKNIEEQSTDSSRKVRRRTLSPFKESVLRSSLWICSGRKQKRRLLRVLLRWPWLLLCSGFSAAALLVPT